MPDAGIKYDGNYKKVELAIKRMPVFVETSARFYTQAHARQFLKFLRDNIIGKKLRLKPLQKRKGGIPLFWTGDLVRLLSVKKTGAQKKGSYLAGAVGNKRHRSGLTIRHIMHIHEYGRTIFITEKMRAFLHAVLKIHPRKETTTVRIPPRAAVRRSFNRYMRSSTLLKKVNEEFRKDIRRMIRKGDTQARNLRKFFEVVR